MFKNPARSLPRERVVMRFSSNEGQNIAPDVILILIKVGRVLVVGMELGSGGGVGGGIRVYIVKYN